MPNAKKIRVFRNLHLAILILGVLGVCVTLYIAATYTFLVSFRMTLWLCSFAVLGSLIAAWSLVRLRRTTIQPKLIPVFVAALLSFVPYLALALFGYALIGIGSGNA